MPSPPPGAPSHIVVVTEENHDYSQIVGNPSAPYISQLAQSGMIDLRVR
jgi:acid phosphatase